MKRSKHLIFFIILICLFLNSIVFAAPSDDFVITVDTARDATYYGTADTQFEIPTNNTYSYNYNVDCNNDGTDEATGISGNYICDYGSTGLNTGAGIYTIRIKDNTGSGTGFPTMYFNYGGDRRKILTVNQWGTIHWRTFYKFFGGCGALNSHAPQGSQTAGLSEWATDSPDLTNVTNMSYMFSGAINFNQNISSWDTKNITNMSWMFANAFKFNHDIGSWNTENVINMSRMFYKAKSFNQDLGSWNTGNVTDMDAMFTEATNFNGNIGNWNTEKVTDMHWMFYSAENFNQDIGNWNTGNVTDMHEMFNNTKAFNQDLGNWNTEKVTNMYRMFANATDFNQDLGSWNTGNVTNMSGMFAEAANFNGNIGNWNTENVTDMSRMFYKSTTFNGDIGNWNTENVTDMSGMFYNATSFNQDIKNWNVTSLTNADEMFTNATLSTTNYDALLIGWNAQTLQNGVDFSGGNSKYCDGENARQSMIDNNSWNITDGGKDCTPITPSTAPDLIDSSDNGFSKTDNITNATTPTFSVKCSKAGNSITLYSNVPANNTVIGTHNCTTNGKENITSTQLSNGVHNINYTETRESYESAHSPEISVTIDTDIPNSPVVSTPTNNSTIDDNTPNFDGTGEIGAIINVTDGNNHSCSATVDNSGNWSCNVAPALNDGAVTFSVTQTDIAGNTSSKTNVTFIIDTSDIDHDGIANNIENNAPNNGDGNGDGIIDGDQSNVATFLSSTGNGYITVEILNGGSCNHLTNVSAVNPPKPDPSGLTYPFGLAEFEIACSDSVIVRVYFHNSFNLRGYEYRKYGPTPPNFLESSWYTMSKVIFGTKKIGKKTVAYAEFTLTNGQLGDDTDASDNIIFDQGGPGIQPGTVTPANVPALNEWGVILASLLAGFFAFRMLRKNNA